MPSPQGREGGLIIHMTWNARTYIELVLIYRLKYQLGEGETILHTVEFNSNIFYFIIYFTFLVGRKLGIPTKLSSLPNCISWKLGGSKDALKLDRDLHPGHPLKSLFSEATNP